MSRDDFPIAELTSAEQSADQIDKNTGEAEKYSDIRNRLEAYKGQNSMVWLSAQTGIAEGTLRAFVAGKYNGVYANIAEKAERFFENIEAKAQQIVIKTPSFIETEIFNRIYDQLLWGHMGNMVTITGDPGVGKTTTLKRYSDNNPNVWMVTASDAYSGTIPIIRALAQVMKIPLKNGWASNYYSEAIRKFVSGKSGLIIIDEAGWLKMAAVEELRAIHDATEVGIALCGNRNILSQGGGQLTSRAASKITIPAAPVSDVALFLDAWGVTQEDERAYLTQIAMMPGRGSIRALTQTLKMATMSAQRRNSPRTLAHIQRAAAHHDYHIQVKAR